MNQFRIVRSACLLIALLAISGCGYHWSDNAGTGTPPDPDYAWRGLFRQDVKTVAVPIFTNQTYYRGVEFNLTKAIINQLESRTPYKVVPKERADTILEGQIINVQVISQSRSQAGIPQEQLFVVIVNFTWKDLRTGQILVTRHNFGQTSPYYPTLGEDQFAGSQQNLEQLGLGVVEELQAEWGNTKTSTTQPSPAP